MEFFDIIGWVGAAFTLIAASRRTMLPLRVAAICASCSTLVYGIFGGLLPFIALHSALLPFHCYRLFEIIRQERRMRAARHGDHSLEWLKPLMKKKSFSAGEIVFNRGDPPDFLYYIDSGTVALEDVGITLGEGELLGEIAFFSDAQARTATARAETDCELLRIDETAFGRLYFQNPEFGLYLARVIVNRMLEQSPVQTSQTDTEEAAPPGPTITSQPT
ncbi:MAG: cyclic nucleotide-binding domain-containing protein [Pseudomonadota bacterium]